MFKKILVAVDGSGHASKAVRCAGDMAKTYGATLMLLAIDGHRPLADPLAELAKSEDLSRSEVFERILSSARQIAEVPNDVKVEQRVDFGDPADVILSVAEVHPLLNGHVVGHLGDLPG